MHAQNDLDVFGGLLLAAVELSLHQRDVEVVPHVSCRDDVRGTSVTRLSEQQKTAPEEERRRRRLQPTWEDDFREAHFPDDGRAAVHKVGVVLLHLGQVSGEQLQGHKQPCGKTREEVR